MAKKNLDQVIEAKLLALYNLQNIESEIDRIKIVRGELPLEVQDLEDELAGITTRLNKLTEELEHDNTEITNKSISIKESKVLIKKYEEQQNKVRNNREYDSLTKEIEFQTLEMQLAEKKIKEFKFMITEKKEVIEASNVVLVSKQEDLKAKKDELDEIVAETEKELAALETQSEKASKVIEERLFSAYKRIRNNARNGLAVVPIERDSCGGCYNKIPAQRQLDIKSRKKVIVCEHCGRILIDGVENKKNKKQVTSNSA